MVWFEMISIGSITYILICTQLYLTGAFILVRDMSEFDLCTLLALKDRLNHLQMTLAARPPTRKHYNFFKTLRDHQSGSTRVVDSRYIRDDMDYFRLFQIMMLDKFSKKDLVIPIDNARFFIKTTKPIRVVDIWRNIDIMDSRYNYWVTRKILSVNLVEEEIRNLNGANEERAFFIFSVILRPFLVATALYNMYDKNYELIKAVISFNRGQIINDFIWYDMKDHPNLKFLFELCILNEYYVNVQNKTMTIQNVEDLLKNIFKISDEYTVEEWAHRSLSTGNM